MALQYHQRDFHHPGRLIDSAPSAEETAMPINLDELKNATSLRGRRPRNGGTFVAPVDGRAHVSGERTVPLLQQTIPALLSDTVSRYGTLDAAVFVEQDKRFTWSELSDTVDALAAGFLALGLEKGDRVGIWSPNRWEWLVTQFATARIGLILVNINPAYRLTELDYALNKVACRALVTAAKFKTSDYLGMIETLAPEIATATPGKLEAKKLPALKIVIRMGEENSPGMFNFADVLAMAGRDEHDSLDRISEGLKPGDAINIQFTSGTTGAAKGRDADPQQHRQQRQIRHIGDQADRRGPVVHPGARSITASACRWERSAASPRAQPWSSRARASMPAPR